MFSLPRFRLTESLACHTSNHTSWERGSLLGPLEQAVGDVLRRFSTTSHSVWGRVVPDIPAFCRELVAALAEQ